MTDVAMQEAQRLISEDQCREDRLLQERKNMARSRKVDPHPQKAQKST